jgi:ABC-type spermidine/putrescine transport system permease subunit II
MLNIGLGLTTVTISHSILGLGFSIPLMFLRFKDLNPTLLEASAILGASSWTTFRRIVLPFMMPVLLGSGLMVFILSFDDFILAYFCAGSSAQTLSLFLVASLRYGVSPVINALSTFVLLFTILITTLIFLLKRKEGVETC